MSQATDAYFAKIAELAEAAIAKEQPNVPTPPVVDGPQDPKSTAWASRSVHPLQVLETAYVGVVQRAVEQAGHDTNRSREAEFDAMSRFYALTSSAPTLLHPESDPLIDDRLKALSSQMANVKDLLKDKAPGAYDALVRVVEGALKTLVRMTSTTRVQYAEAPIRDAAAYADLFPQGVQAALASWQTANPNQPPLLDNQVDDVDRHLVRPLLSQGIAVASPRSLYNIEAFYLFRLLHRFLGGTFQTPMDLTQKGIASGAATGAMHPPSAKWLASWHEHQVILLSQELTSLAMALGLRFKTKCLPIRFFLKGGRAMNTVLGTPDEGTNDWDTGILIDPHLSPEQWYEAFSQVNDVVLHFLDRARFRYSELLNENAQHLPASATADHGVETDDEVSEITQAGLWAEHLAEQSANGTEAVFLNQGATFRPSGVNGELIDVSASTRSSVELLEFWDHMQIVKRPGVTGDDVPVPDLAFFVDDFTTIIREAIATDTADRKLAKRLVRLHRVLSSQDPAFVQQVKIRFSRLVIALPKTVAALNLNHQSPENRLDIWLLDALFQSIPAHEERHIWDDELDSWIAKHKAHLYNKDRIAALWLKVKEAFKTPTDAANAKPLLISENAAHLIVLPILQDAHIVGQAIAPAPNGSPLQAAMHRLLQEIFTLPNTPGSFALTGLEAARRQTSHAGLAIGRVNGAAVSAAIEIAYHPGHPPHVDFILSTLATRLTALHIPNIEITYDGLTQILSAYTTTPIPGRNIVANKTLVLLVRAANEIEARSVIDSIDGVPVTSLRGLIPLFGAEAANSPDMDIRTALKTTAQVLLKDVLGRQIS